MATYAEMRDWGHDARVVWWLEVSGIPIIVYSDFITPAHFAGDAYMEQSHLTWLKLLKQPGATTAKSIDLIAADAKTSGFQVEVIDAPVEEYDEDGLPTSTDKLDGYFTWLLGSERASIGRARLAEDIDLSETVWDIDNGTLPVVDQFVEGCPDLGEIPIPTQSDVFGIAYIGLETVLYQNPCVAFPGSANPDRISVTRSAFHSEARPYRGKVFGTATFREEVTDHPTLFKGRFVHLFQTYMDPLGRLATVDGTPAGARAAAKRISGVWAESPENGGVYTIRCNGLESLLNRKILRAPPRSRISPTANVNGNIRIVGGDGGAWDDAGAVLAVDQYDAGGAPTDVWHVGIAGGAYTDEAFVRAVNEALQSLGNGLNGTPFRGQLTMHLDAQQLTIRYTLDAVNPRSTRIDFSNTLEGEGGRGTDIYWAKFGLLPDGNGQVRMADPIGPGNEYTRAVPRAPHVLLALGDPVERLYLTPGPGEAPAVAFNNGMEYAAIESEAGREIVRITDIDVGDGSILVDRRVFAIGQYPEHAATAETPVHVKQVYVGTGLRQSTLQVLMSVSGTNYNDADGYDVLPEGFGIGIPNDILNAGVTFDEGLIDIGAFERFLAEANPQITHCFDVIDEPTEAREWLRQRIELFNGYLAIEDGKLTVGKGLAATRDQARRITHKLTDAAVKKGWKPGAVEIVRGVHYRLNWKHGRKIWRDEPYFSLSDSAANPEDRWVERSDKGVYMTVDQARVLAEEILEELGHESPTITCGVLQQLSDLEPGMAVLFSDEGADEATQPFRKGRGLPNLDGTRGHRETPCIVIAARGTKGKKLGLTLFMSRKKRGGYSPGAWIETFATDTPSAGTTRLQCTQQVFAPASVGRDVSLFVVGEKVKVCRASAPTGAVGESAGHTVSAIDVPNNRIEIQPNVAGAGIVSTETLFLVHDDYQTASQPQTAKDWCAIGDDSGDIGDTADPCYDW